MSDKLTMIELFSGIGAQEKAMRKIGIPYQVVHTCDCDKDAMLSYVSMRFDLDKEIEAFCFPSQEQMIEELQTKNVGYNFQKYKHTITSRTPIKKLKQYYIADKLSHNLGDISKVKKLPYVDMVTYSFPCTDISCSGRTEGMSFKCEKCGYSWPMDFNNADENINCPNCGNEATSSTRSGLLGQVQRLLYDAHQDNNLPKYLLLENVKNLIGKQFKPQFDAWIKWLNSIGYNTYYEVLNSKYFGVPQNRERIFAVSIRKDVDNNTFKFPENTPLTIRLKDVLEKNVADKYYISNEKVDQIIQSHEFKKLVEQFNDNPFIVASRGRNPDNPSDRTTGCPTEQRFEPNFNGTTNTITTVQKDNYVCEPNVTTIKVRNQATEFAGCTDIAGTLLARDYKGFGNQEMVAVVEECTDRIINVGQVSSEGSQSGMVYDSNGIFPTICACTHGYAIGNILENNISYRIRKLTPLECWRLMGFSDNDCLSASNYVSDTALYKQAGNSIVVNVLEKVFGSLFVNS